MDKYLIVKGCAGLGNRLTTLYAAINYCRKTNRVLFVDWRDGMFAEKGVNAFYEYFSLSGVKFIDSPAKLLDTIEHGASTYPSLLTVEDLNRGIYERWHMVSGWLARYVPIYRVVATMFFRGKTSAVLGLQSWQRNKDPHDSYLHRLIKVFKDENIMLGSQLPYKLNKDVLVFADFRPYLNLSNLFEYIILKEEYKQRFESFAKKHKLFEHGIGLHIRATDKRPKMRMKKLVERLTEDLNKDEETKVFLSTDNVEVAKHLMQSLGSRVIEYPKFLPSPQELNGRGVHQWALAQEKGVICRMFEESLADMWILSMCAKLYWQGNSSFSQMSSILKKDKENVVNWLKL